MRCETEGADPYAKQEQQQNKNKNRNYRIIKSKAMKT